jgi:hypothetical protein
MIHGLGSQQGRIRDLLDEIPSRVPNAQVTSEDVHPSTSARFQRTARKEYRLESKTTVNMLPAAQTPRSKTTPGKRHGFLWSTSSECTFLNVSLLIGSP